MSSPHLHVTAGKTGKGGEAGKEVIRRRAGDNNEDGQGGRRSDPSLAAQTPEAEHYCSSLLLHPSSLTMGVLHTGHGRMAILESSSSISLRTSISPFFSTSSHCGESGARAERV